MLNECTVEQLVMEPTSREATLDLIISGNQDLVNGRDVRDW